ncbi:WD domain protein [Aspergillus granulosus]|uniref:WD domain protein n=1 Tax=Aspergillus granulosus TaxID=176169 RepID=A0ABR4HDP2_9EURO
MSDPDQYNVGWICALETEHVAARAFLDKKHSRPKSLSPNDNNHYTLGEIGEYGTASAAGVAKDMLHSFPNIRFGLMVGIGGGVPTKRDIRLGDVVVSSPRNGLGGLLQYDFGKELQGREFHQTGFLNQPPQYLRTAVAGLQAQYKEEGHQLKKSIQTVLEGNKRLRQQYTKPPSATDRLYQSQFIHPDPQARCAELCDDSKLISRPERTEDEDDPAIHYGLIASGNRVIKDAIFRDKLAEQDILCFEMEAAGLVNHFPCLVIRGVCDYADSHKSNEWQGYAAMVAAAYAKDLLYQIIPQRIRNQLENVSEKLQAVRTIVNTSACDIHSIAEEIDMQELPMVTSAEFNSYMDQHERQCIFWLNGMAGTGKSTVARTMAKSLQKNGLLGASFFFKRGDGDRGNATKLFPTIIRQLLARNTELITAVFKAIKDDPRISGKPLEEQFNKLILQPLLGLKKPHTLLSTIIILIDALDECENDNDIQAVLRLLPRLHNVRSVHLRVLITSRPELPIQLGFKQDVKDHYQDFILHRIPEPVMKHDISLFLKYHLAIIREKRSLPENWPGDMKTQTLIEMSVPLFIFAATICRILQDQQWSPVESLSEILAHQTDTSQLKATYLPVLDRLLVGQGGAKKAKLTEEYRVVLGSVILLENPLPVRSLATLIGVENELLCTRLNFLRSILDVPLDKTTPVQLFHLSLRDFLLDPSTREDTPFWIDEKEMNQRLTSYCLNTMHKSLKRNICSLQSHGTERRTIDSQSIQHYLSPELQYSCRYWTHHLARGNDQIGQANYILAFLKEHFLHWVEVMSLLGNISEVIEDISDLQSAARDTKDSEISQFLQDAKRFILKNSQIADIAPLQLYASGIIFAPKTAITRKNFERELPHWISRGPRVEETWSTELQTLEGHFDSINSVAFSPDGQLLASGSGDRTVKLWDPATSTLKHTLEGHGHFDSINSVAFSLDGQLLASSSLDRTIKLWDPATGTLKHTLSTNGIAISIEFSKKLPQLITNLGTFNIQAWHESLSSNSSEIKTEVSLQLDRWVAIQGRRELWIPLDYVPTSSAVKDGTIALGCRNGRVCIMTFSI